MQEPRRVLRAGLVFGSELLALGRFFRILAFYSPDFLAAFVSDFAFPLSEALVLFVESVLVESVDFVVFLSSVLVLAFVDAPGLSMVVGPLTLIWGLICFMRPGPMPGTFSRSSILLNEPFLVR